MIIHTQLLGKPTNIVGQALQIHRR